ncbi:MAG: hypothetical protein M3Q07_22160 [Pseudobdellovibrionaceae bacterium]|nr:hypothetical protein [Pseudobdellovibrionaceae bacterium]
MRFLMIMMLALGFLPQSALGALPFDKTIELHSDAEQVVINQFSYLVDPLRGMDLENVRNKDGWSLNERPAFNFGFAKADYWITFRVRNNETVLRDWILELQYAPLDNVDLYVIHEDGRVTEKKGGDRRPFAERDIAYRTTNFVISAAAGESLTFYLKLNSQSSIQGPLVLWTPTRFIEKASNELVGFALYVGLLLSMVKRGLAACPKEASWMSEGLKWMMASVYLFNPASSAHHRSQALQIYEEAKMFDDEVTKFNVGVAKLFYFNDPEGALKQFAKVKMAAARLVPDAIVFSAFTYSKLGRRKEALDELSSVRFDGSESPKRMAFLQCYMAMTKINSGTGEDLSDCFSLPDDTQADVVDHVTKEISMMSVPMAAENKLFRQFWRYYLKLILHSVEDLYWQAQNRNSAALYPAERFAALPAARYCRGGHQGQIEA